MEQGINSASRTTEQAGDLGDGIALQPQFHHLPLPFGQVGEGILKDFRSFSRRILFGAQKFQRQFVKVFQPRFQRNCFLTAKVLLPFEAKVNDDAVHPTPEASGRLPVVSGSDDSQESLLGNILSVLLVSQDLIRQTLNPIVVAPVKGIKGEVIAVGEGCHEKCVWVAAKAFAVFAQTKPLAQIRHPLRAALTASFCPKLVASLAATFATSQKGKHAASNHFPFAAKLSTFCGCFFLLAFFLLCCYFPVPFGGWSCGLLSGSGSSLSPCGGCSPFLLLFRLPLFIGHLH
jgi:hypothetical protein